MPFCSASCLSTIVLLLGRSALLESGVVLVRREPRTLAAMTDAGGQNPTHHLRAKNRADLKRQLENATYEIVRETSLGGAEWPKDIEYRLLPSDSYPAKMPETD